jgi:hypothetical protein
MMIFFKFLIHKIVQVHDQKIIELFVRPLVKSNFSFIP